MIILDTNVISEPMNLRGDLTVQAWFDRQAPGSLYLTAISLAELLFGIEILPLGKRRYRLEKSLTLSITDLFESRILAFDRPAATAYAVLASRARFRGRPLSIPDAQIAAIASVRGFAVATRDIAPFVIAGVQVINPWEGQGG